MDMSKYMSIFKKSTKEKFDRLENLIPELKDDVKNSVLIEELYRIIHTLKGLAKTMAFNELAEKTDAMKKKIEPINLKEVEMSVEFLEEIEKELKELQVEFYMTY